MKPIIITLLYLTFGGEIKMESFEINTTCDGWFHTNVAQIENTPCLLYTSPSPRDRQKSRMPSSA